MVDEAGHLWGWGMGHGQVEVDGIRASTCCEGDGGSAEGNWDGSDGIAWERGRRRWSAENGALGDDHTD